MRVEVPHGVRLCCPTLSAAANSPEYVLWCTRTSTQIYDMGHTHTQHTYSLSLFLTGHFAQRACSTSRHGTARRNTMYLCMYIYVYTYVMCCSGCKKMRRASATQSSISCTLSPLDSHHIFFLSVFPFLKLLLPQLLSFSSLSSEDVKYGGVGSIFLRIFTRQ
mmetsp:Transcript_61643/g.99676  ORF Transcript_61643/g.99676 Transcript_61643/m.99676 type:complete len:163 (-) Transcript_61643:67-555(-)